LEIICRRPEDLTLGLPSQLWTINRILVQEKGEERQEQDPDTDLDMDSFLSDLERNSARTSGTFRSNTAASILFSPV
jgi:hypothetical protein